MKPPGYGDTFSEFAENVLEQAYAADFARICADHHVRLFDVWAHDRHAPIVRARAAIWFFQRSNNESYPSIARLWGRDHTTVMHSIARHEERLRASAPKLRIA